MNKEEGSKTKSVDVTQAIEQKNFQVAEMEIFQVVEQIVFKPLRDKMFQLIFRKIKLEALQRILRLSMTKMILFRKHKK